MDRTELFEGLRDALVSLEKEKVQSYTETALAMDLAPLDIIDYALLPGLTTIGKQYEDGEVFLPELMLSAMMFQNAMAVLQPRIKALGGESRKKGTVVIGTVKGDMHHIGKNIVRLLLETSGFEVHDLGVDVDPKRFVQKAIEVQADIIALSTLLTTTLGRQRDVIAALEAQGVRDRFKVMVGGGAVTKKWSEDIHADGYAETAYAAVEMAGSFVHPG